VNDETDLRKLIAYLHDFDTELEERSAVSALGVNSAAREDLLCQLDHAWKLVANLERQAPNIRCLSCHEGREVLIDLHKARTWSHLVEAKNNARLRGPDSGQRARMSGSAWNSQSLLSHRVVCFPMQGREAWVSHTRRHNDR
jgi:hypothetical protein